MSGPGINITQGDGFGTGASIDGDGEPVVVTWVYYRDDAIGVSFSALAARQVAAALLVMADEVDTLTAKISEMSDEAIETEMRRISERLNQQE